jgi:hypothetical protein
MENCLPIIFIHAIDANLVMLWYEPETEYQCNSKNKWQKEWGFYWLNENMVAITEKGICNP